MPYADLADKRRRRMKKITVWHVLAFNVFMKLLIYGLGILVIYWLLLKITGHSPTGDQIMIVFLTLLSGLVMWSIRLIFKSSGELHELRGEFRQFAKHAEAEFARINAKLDR